MYDAHITQLGADKAEVDKRLSSEEQKVLNSQSLVQQLSADNKKLEADLANLQVNPDVTCFTRTKVQMPTVMRLPGRDRRHNGALHAAADSAYSYKSTNTDANAPART